jgi:signal transduction histidine kinase
MLLAIAGVALAVGGLLAAAMLTERIGSAFHIAWFIPTVDAFLVLVTTSAAYLAFSRYQALNDTASFWTAIGCAGFAVGTVFHFLTFPGVRAPGVSIIGELPRTTAWHISSAQQLLATAFLLTSVARWPRRGSRSRTRGFWTPAAPLLGFALLNLSIVALEHRLPVLIGADQRFTSLLVAWQSIIAAVSGTGAVLSLRRYLRTGDVLSGYIAMFQVVIVYIGCISAFTTMIRFGLTWHLLFIGWVLGFAIVFFGLLREYAHLFRREQETTRQLREREDALTGALHAREEFISIASHELKTPITSMQLQMQMLDRKIVKDGVGAIEPASVVKAVTNSVSQLARIDRLVENMLDISRISTARLALRPGPVDLGALAAEVVERFQKQLESARCETRLDLQRGVVGWWDRSRIDQVMTNLLANAIKYAAGKPIEISVRLNESGRAVLSVRDHGGGIEEAAQARIFGRFERAISYTKISGLGLGLYIVGEILKLHGGTIRVESAPEEGSTFIVELPLGSRREEAR